MLIYLHYWDKWSNSLLYYYYSTEQLFIVSNKNIRFFKSKIKETSGCIDHYSSAEGAVSYPINIWALSLDKKHFKKVENLNFKANPDSFDTFRVMFMWNKHLNRLNYPHTHCPPDLTQQFGFKATQLLLRKYLKQLWYFSCDSLFLRLK